MSLKSLDTERRTEMNTGQIIVAVLTSSAFTGLLVEIVREIRRAVDRRRNKGFVKLEKDIHDLKDIAIDNTQRIDGIKEELERQKETDLVLLHDRIWDMFNRLQGQEEITVEDKANLEYLYDEYRQNNGNHHAEIMYEVIEAKPIIKKKGEQNGLHH